jgi:hypothetical protein
MAEEMPKESDQKAPRERAFLGTYKCVLCGCRVRIYDWLPEPVLCSKCQALEARAEARSME